MNIDLEWALGCLFPRQYLLIHQCDHDPLMRIPPITSTNYPQVLITKANQADKQTKHTVLILRENSDVTAAKVQL